MPMSQAMWRSQSISVSPRRPSHRAIKFPAWSATSKSRDFASILQMETASGSAGSSNFGGSLSLIEY